MCPLSNTRGRLCTRGSVGSQGHLLVIVLAILTDCTSSGIHTALQTLHLHWLQQHPGEGKCVELVCSSAWAEMLQLKPAFTMVHQGENLDHSLIFVKQMLGAVIVHPLPLKSKELLRSACDNACRQDPDPKEAQTTAWLNPCHQHP